MWKRAGKHLSVMVQKGLGWLCDATFLLHHDASPAQGWVYPSTSKTDHRIFWPCWLQHCHRPPLQLLQRSAAFIIKKIQITMPWTIPTDLGFFLQVMHKLTWISVEFFKFTPTDEAWKLRGREFEVKSPQSWGKWKLNSISRPDVPPDRHYPFKLQRLAGVPGPGCYGVRISFWAAPMRNTEGWMPALEASTQSS